MNHPNVRLLRVTSNEYNGNSTVKFQTNDYDLHNVTRLHLKTAIIPNSQYNIYSRNNLLNITWTDMSGPVESIPVGQYTITSFIDALKTVLDVAAAPLTFNITYDPLTYKITFTKSGGSEFTIASAITNPMYLAIGQDKEKTSVGLTLTCDNLFNISGLKHVYIESQVLGKQLCVGQTARKYNIIGDIPINNITPFGSYETNSFNEDTLNSVYFHNRKMISNFEISLCNEFGHKLELNGLHWTLIFEIHG